MYINRVETQSFGSKLSKKSHQNMLELLKKMHAEDSIVKTPTNTKSTSVCVLKNGDLKISTCKMPTLAPSKLTADEFVRAGGTHFTLNKGKPTETLIEVNNESGETKTIYNGLKKSWKELKKELSEKIDDTLKNYDTPKVEKQKWSMNGVII